MRQRPRTTALIAGIVALVVLVGGGIYLITRDGSTKKIAAGVTTATDVSVTTSPTTTPATTAAATTTESVVTFSLPTFTLPIQTTTTFTVPAGALDLGNKVYLPVPDGWKQISNPGNVVVLSDGTVSLAVQVLLRTPGENPAALVQEYTDTFDANYDAVGYNATLFSSSDTTGALPIDQYFTYYTTLAADGSSIEGNAASFIRSDGLSVIYDIYSAAGQPTSSFFPQDAYNVFYRSFSTAPAVGPTATLQRADPFRVNSSHPFIQVDGLVGFTAAPGFSTVSADGGAVFLSNGTEDFEAVQLSGQSSIDAVVEAAKAHLAPSYADAAYGSVTTYPPNDNGVVQSSIGWNGTYTNGNPAAGVVDCFLNPKTGLALMVLRSWYTSGSDNSEPFPNEGIFMFHTVVKSFNNLP
ncbi:MAG: hypothetical protein ACXV8K_11670 [Ilumatobacteraceae bacterium]